MLEDDARPRRVVEEDDVLVVICTIEAALLEKVQREGAIPACAEESVTLLQTTIKYLLLIK